MERRHERLRSPLLGRDMEYLRFGRAGTPLVMFPTSAGRFWENEERGMVAALEGAVDAGRVQVFLVDSLNAESWGDESLPMGERVKRHDLYDRHLAEEFVPGLHEKPILYGASFGAYHAANFAGRHPEQAAACIGFSGFFDLSRVLRGYWDDLCYFHSPAAYVSNMDAEWVARLGKVRWALATGEGDGLVEETRNFAGILRRKGIPVHSEIWPGVFGHDWPFWRQHLPRMYSVPATAS